MRFKKIVDRIHLWLGLSSGLLVLFLGITGCILAFQKEIENATQGYRYIQKQEKAFLSPSRLKTIAAEKLPGKHVHSVLYEKDGRAAQVIFFRPDPFEYYFVYMDPYTGEVLKVKNMQQDFFYQVLQGHYYLWLPPRIGQPIVASATLVFVIMLASGIVLWWPKNKAASRQRFSVKWKAKWRRLNYDLHHVPGFYMSLIAFLIAFTGLVFGFQWFAKTVYTVAGGKKSIVYSEPASDTSGVYAETGTPVIDKVWEKMKREYKDAAVIEIHIPETAASSIVAYANSSDDTYWRSEYRFFDQYTLEELPVNTIYGRNKNMDGADKLIRMNYDIHTGAIAGLPGKILVFLASLIASSLPVTGFIIWWGRRNKNRAKTTGELQ